MLRSISIYSMPEWQKYGFICKCYCRLCAYKLIIFVLARSLTQVPPRFIQGPDVCRSTVFGSQKYNHQPIPLFPSKQFTTERYSYPTSIKNRISESSMLPMRGTFDWERCGEIYSFSQFVEPYMGATGRITVDNNKNHYLKNYQSSSVGFVSKPENFSMSQTTQRKNQFLQALGLSHKQEKSTLGSTLMSKRVGRSSLENVASNRKRLSLMRSRKKIRNITEFKNLLKEAENKPKLYPSVLTNKKTKFLAGLSLAPKRICSSKMLSKFGEEFHQTQAMERRGLVRCRKVLRDRNKLIKKKSHQQKPERFSYLSTPHKLLMRNVIAPLDNGKKESKLNEREDRIGLLSKRSNFLQFPYSEAKKPFDEVEHIDRLDSGANAYQNYNLLKNADDNKMFASGVRSYLHTQVASNGPSVQEQSKRYCQEQYRNHYSLSSSNDSFPKFNPVYNNLVRTPQPQFSFMAPLLIPVSSSASSVAFLPPSSFPLVVRPLNPHPLTKPQALHVNAAGQSTANTPIVWGYLQNGRVNVLNQDGNSKPESKRFPQNTDGFIGNNMSEERASGSIQPYRLLAPTNKVPEGLEIRPIPARKSDLSNIPARNVHSEIRSNVVQNQLDVNYPAIPTNRKKTNGA